MLRYAGRESDLRELILELDSSDGAELVKVSINTGSKLKDSQYKMSHGLLDSSECLDAKKGNMLITGKTLTETKRQPK